VILTDTHCHLDLENFDLDRASVLERAALAGVSHILIPGLNLPSSLSALKLAESHPLLSAAIGVHPTESATWTASSINELSSLASGASGAFGSSDASGAYIASVPSSPSGTSDPSYTSHPSRIVAIGEIGLDYYWNSATQEIQKTILRAQLDLAARMGLPVILHMREAKDSQFEQCAADLLQILETWMAGLRLARNPLAGHPGVLHSFSGSLETARHAMRLGFYIGVTGSITFRNTPARQEIIAALPLDHILIETDAPFQAPHPYRGKRNEPSYVRLIADKIALLLSRTVEDVAAVTSENAERLFAWKETV
jgi:TatD DNase family protein